MKDFGISRVSTEEQKANGLSADIQASELKQPSSKYPDKNILESDIIKAEGVSAGFKENQITKRWEGTKFIITFECKDRIDIIKIVEYIRLHPNESTRIFFTRWDRLSRDFSFLQQFIEWIRSNNTQLCPLQDSTEDIVRQILSMFAQYERGKAITRVKDHAQGQYQIGIWAYKTPYGYDKVKEKISETIIKGSLTMTPHNQEIIRACFNAAIKAKETGNKKLYKEVCEKYQIEPSTYYQTIKNKAYMGMTHYKNEWRTTPYIQKIITEKEYEKANKKN